MQWQNDQKLENELLPDDPEIIRPVTQHMIDVARFHLLVLSRGMYE